MPEFTHLHMLGRAVVANPPRDVETAKAWLTGLVDKLGMKTLMGPYAINCDTLGNEGITGAVVIETSHVTFHCWSEVEKPFIMFDVYSCLGFDAEMVSEHIEQHFDLKAINYAVYDRTHGIHQTQMVDRIVL